MDTSVIIIKKKYCFHHKLNMDLKVNTKKTVCIVLIVLDIYFSSLHLKADKSHFHVTDLAYL